MLDVVSGTTIKDLCELLIRLKDSEQKIKYEPAGQTFVTNRIGCPVKAKEDLNFEWTVNLEDGMKSLIEWRNADKEALEGKRAKLGGVSHL